MTDFPMPQPGDTAPEFTLPRDGGGVVSLQDFKGKFVVLFFYPKDSTPGCTTEALDFTARARDFAELNTVVLGVSKDSVKRHDNFVSKQGLQVALLSDAESDTCERYGVWAEKKMYGKTFMGIVRTSFLIDPEGTISKVWPKVKVDGHAEEVLNAVRSQ